MQADGRTLFARWVDLWALRRAWLSARARGSSGPRPRPAAEVGEPLVLRHLVRGIVEASRVVELDEVAGGVADVHLDAAVGELVHALPKLSWSSAPSSFMRR